MASLKRSYTKTTLLDLSAKIMDRLEETDLFQQASCIALYHAIPGEVQTAGLIEKWYRKKRLLLPLIKGNDLQLLLYAGKESLKKWKQVRKSADQDIISSVHWRDDKRCYVHVYLLRLPQ